MRRGAAAKPSGRRQIHQLSVSAARGDAIGNEVLQIRDALRAAGHRSEIFVDLVDPRLASEVRPFQEYRELSNPQNIVLLHYSLGSKVSALARSLSDRLVLIYHNITPAEWFAPYNIGLARNCQRGRLELSSLAPHCCLALGDSEYNRLELESLGFDPTGVLPLILDLSRLDRPADPLVEQQFEDGCTNLLFVGRIVPNKRFEDLIRCLAYYRRYIDRRVRLILVGEFLTFAPYYDALHHLIERLGLDEVHFTGHVSEAELNAYYSVAHCFLCLSEHEGFCVPIFEAIHRSIPVVAFSAAAVPYSTGEGVLLIDDKDPAAVAETVALVLHDTPMRRRLLARQQRILDSLDPAHLMARLMTRLAELPT